MDDAKAGRPGADGYFIPAARAGGEELRREIETVSKNPVIDRLLETVYGLLAVLNEQRQILAVNHTLLTTMGVKEGDLLLGLRPGEAIQCVHAHEGAEGCGTSKFCSTCGAAIAIVATLGTDRPAERMRDFRRERREQDRLLLPGAHAARSLSRGSDSCCCFFVTSARSNSDAHWNAYSITMSATSSKAFSSTADC